MFNLDSFISAPALAPVKKEKVAGEKKARSPRAYADLRFTNIEKNQKTTVNGEPTTVKVTSKIFTVSPAKFAELGLETKGLIFKIFEGGLYLQIVGEDEATVFKAKREAAKQKAESFSNVLFEDAVKTVFGKLEKGDGFNITEVAPNLVYQVTPKTESVEAEVATLVEEPVVEEVEVW